MSDDLCKCVAKDVSKTDYLKFTYKEVLDATKHQDDKIGRILTALAFLSTSAFAMANLDQGRLLFQQFSYENETKHIAVYALGVFALGVIATILLLMSSFSTPLHFPNMTSESEEGIGKKESSASTFYFNEIATISLDEWTNIWESENLEKIRIRREKNLIKETHNLSLRVKIKYDRMTEAVAIFSFSLLAFAVSTLFVVIAANQRIPAENSNQDLPPIAISYHTRMAVVVLFCFYLFIQIHSSYQNRNRFVEYKDNIKKSNPIFLWISASIVVSIFFLSFLDGTQSSTCLLVWILRLCLLIYFLCNLEALQIKKQVFSSLGKFASKRVMERENDDASKDQKKPPLEDREVLLKMAQNELSLLRFSFLLVQTFVLLWFINFIAGHNSYYSQILGAVILLAIIALKAGSEPSLKALGSRYCYRQILRRGAHKSAPKWCRIRREELPLSDSRKIIENPSV